MLESIPSSPVFSFCGRRPLRYTIRTVFLLSIWYITSSVAVILTKFLFSGSKAHRPFPFALTVTATNNVVAAAVATLLLSPSPDISHESNVNRIALIIGATTAAEIGLSNFALILLSVSYATVLKGMAPVFVMAWGIVLGLQQLRFGIVSAFIAIAVGLSLAVAGETITKPSLSNFANTGFWAQFFSALLSGFRWMLTQVFIKGETISNERISALFNILPLERGLSAVETIRLTAPFTLLCVFPFLVLVEGPAVVRWFLVTNFIEGLVVLSGLTIIGVCVFVLLWSEYELVKVTSSLTVSVGFVLKEVLLVLAGVVIFDERLSALTIAGFVIVECGIIGYALLRTNQGLIGQHGYDVL